MKCPGCNSNIKKTAAICPYCGCTLLEYTNMFLNPEVKKAENKGKTKENHHANGSQLDEKNWIKELSDSYYKTRKICLIGLGFLLFNIWFLPFFLVANKLYIGAILSFLFVALIVFCFIVLLTAKIFVVKNYDKYTILAYRTNGLITVLVDNEEVLSKMTGKYPSEFNASIPGTDIPIRIIDKFNSISIIVNNEDALTKCIKCNQTIKIEETTCPYCGSSQADIFNKKSKLEKKNADNEEKETWVNDVIKETNKAKTKTCIKIWILAFVIAAWFTAVIILLSNIIEYNIYLSYMFPIAIFVYGFVIYIKKSYIIKKYNNSTIIAYRKAKELYLKVDNTQIAYKRLKPFKKRGYKNLSINGYIPNTKTFVEATLKTPMSIVIIEEKVKIKDEMS